MPRHSDPPADPRAIRPGRSVPAGAGGYRRFPLLSPVQLHARSTNTPSQQSPARKIDHHRHAEASGKIGSSLLATHPQKNVGPSARKPCTRALRSCQQRLHRQGIPCTKAEQVGNRRQAERAARPWPNSLEPPRRTPHGSLDDLRAMAAHRGVDRRRPGTLAPFGTLFSRLGRRIRYPAACRDGAEEITRGWGQLQGRSSRPRSDADGQAGR